MRVIAANKKMAVELTKYISPENIEQMRHLKYNAPKIKDGNLLCDKFFRTKELFDKTNDEIRSLQQYSIDDLPLYDRTVVKVNDLKRVEGSNTSYVERDLPYFVDIIGENKRIYLESYGVKNPKHPRVEYVNKYELFANNKPYLNHTIDEVANIRYQALKISPLSSAVMEREALSLLKEGYPLESVVNVMKNSFVKTADGKKRGVPELMRFLMEFPDLKRYMITYAFRGNEVFDTHGAKKFSDLVYVCGGDKKLAYKVLWDCRMEMYNGSYLTDPYALDVGMKLFQRGNEWNDKKAAIVQLLNENIESSSKKNADRVIKMINDEKSLDEIKKELTPKKKSKNSLFSKWFL